MIVSWNQRLLDLTLQTGDFSSKLTFETLQPFLRAHLFQSLDMTSFICCTCVTFACNILDISAQNKGTCDNAARVPESICSRTACPPPPFAIHHMSHLVPSLILQWLRIIVPPVAGFNYSHDAEPQPAAAISSSITKNYGSANLQMNHLLVALCVCTRYDKHLGSKLLMLVFIIFRWVWD